MPASFIILRLRPPLLAQAAPLLPNPADNPMTLLVSHISSYPLAVFVIALAGIFTLALSAPVAQPVFIPCFLVKLALIPYFPTLAALLHLGPLVTRPSHMLKILSKIHYPIRKRLTTQHLFHKFPRPVLAHLPVPMREFITGLKREKNLSPKNRTRPLYNRPHFFLLRPRISKTRKTYSTADRDSD
jgi:hypothetical protein